MNEKFIFLHMLMCWRVATAIDKILKHHNYLLTLVPIAK